MKKFIILCPHCTTEKEVGSTTMSRMRKGINVGCKECSQKTNIRKANPIKSANGVPVSKHKKYRAWSAMMQRCYKPYVKPYPNYGGRGITVCDEWHDPVKFLEWFDSRTDYQDGYELDRIDNNKGYSPENCRYVPREYNNRNKRNNKLTVDDVIKIKAKLLNKVPATHIAAEYGVSQSTILEIKWGNIWVDVK